LIYLSSLYLSSLNLQERISIPQLGESNAIWCRHFATSVSRAYCESAETVERFENTAVLFIMGVPSCERRLSLHAWNWLVDFNYGRVWAFDPRTKISAGPTRTSPPCSIRARR
jgi:hypothetical protein